MGLVTAVAPGNAPIIATSEGKSDTLLVRVLAHVSTVTVTTPGDSIIGTGTLQASATLRDAANNILTGRPIIWASSDPSVATVNAASGLITGVAPGNSTISATSEGQVGVTVVRVLSAVDTVFITPSSASVSAGAMTTLTVNVQDASHAALAGRRCTATSNHSNVAAVSPVTANTDSAGQIALTVTGAATSPPSATITVTCEGKTATSSITVN